MKTLPPVLIRHQSARQLRFDVVDDDQIIAHMPVNGYEPANEW